MRRMQTRVSITIPRSLWIIIGFVGPAWAQTGGGYDLTWSTIDSGGQTSATGGGYDLGGTIGQADAGTLSGGDYALDGGFWSGAAAAPCTCQLYADVAPDGGDCIVELGDVLCVLAGYAATGCPQADIAPCGGDGLTELADVLAVLGAYSEVYLCAHPCAP